MLDSDELRKIYRDLWTLSDDATPPVPVLYWYAPRIPNGASGLFFTHLVGRKRQNAKDHPRIWLGRDPVPADSTEPDLDGATLPELITLAHERGHERSWRKGSYDENSMAEEYRAWDHAKDILGSMGFNDWEAFATAKAHSLDEHRRRNTPE